MDKIPPIPQLKPLVSSETRACLKYPSEVELISLSVDICYKAHLILTNQSKIKEGLKVEDYILKAIGINKVLEDYQNSVIDMREYRKIVKDLGLKTK